MIPTPRVRHLRGEQASASRGRGINNHGEIVGFWDDSAGLRHAFNEAGDLTGEWIDGANVHRGFVARQFLFTDGFESGDFSAWSAVRP